MYKLFQMFNLDNGAAFIWIIVLIVFCLEVSLIKEKKSFLADVLLLSIKSKKAKAILLSIPILFLVFVLFVNNTQFLILTGNEEVDLMPPGRYCYYVKATDEKGRTYTLPAEIQKDGTNIKAGSYVYEVYFKNGGYLYFDDKCKLYSDENYIVYGNSTDQNEREWHIEVTDNKTTHPNVTETDTFDFVEFALPFVFEGALLFILIRNLYVIKKEKKSYV